MYSLLNVTSPDFPTAAKWNGGIFGGWVAFGVMPDRATSPAQHPRPRTRFLDSDDFAREMGNFSFEDTPDVR